MTTTTPSPAFAFGPDQVWEHLKKVIDPELNIDIVSLGLIYEVYVKTVQAEKGPQPFVHILMTLTTPGCPLAGVLDAMVKDNLKDLPGLLPANILVEVTFDPPWMPDMMTEEAKAELGLD
jgi:metal-sulfur cluster biosynthetic enzyme